MCLASTEMPNRTLGVVTAAFPQLAAKVTPKVVLLAKEVPNTKYKRWN